LECLGFIEKCASVYEYDNLMVLGDMNFECNAENRGYKEMVIPSNIPSVISVYLLTYLLTRNTALCVRRP